MNYQKTKRERKTMNGAMIMMTDLQICARLFSDVQRKKTRIAIIFEIATYKIKNFYDKGEMKNE